MGSISQDWVAQLLARGKTDPQFVNRLVFSPADALGELPELDEAAKLRLLGVTGVSRIAGVLLAAGGCGEEAGARAAVGICNNATCDNTVCNNTVCNTTVDVSDVYVIIINCLFGAAATCGACGTVNGTCENQATVCALCATGPATCGEVSACGACGTGAASAAMFENKLEVGVLPAQAGAIKPRYKIVAVPTE